MENGKKDNGVGRTTKSGVLGILEKKKGTYVSGEDMASELNVSRNMIWRAIKSLKNEGYLIDASTKRGYCLNKQNDIVSVEGIRPFLKDPDIANVIKVYSIIDSTNKEAKAQAILMPNQRSIIIADSQSHGIGRLNHEFFSPPGTGLYMSFILYPDDIPYTTPIAITSFVGVCICEAIKKLSKIETSIKWVNDIFIGDKKVAGILTEAITDFESNTIHEIILGVGININTKKSDFPENLKEIASSLYPNGSSLISRNELAAEIINSILLSSFPTEIELFQRYKRKLCMLNAEVIIRHGKDIYNAKALDIDERGYLIVETQNGDKKTLSNGETISF